MALTDCLPKSFSLLVFVLDFTNFEKIHGLERWLLDSFCLVFLSPAFFLVTYMLMYSFFFFFPFLSGNMLTFVWTIYSCSRSIFKRSLSDGNILHECSSPISAANGKQEKYTNSVLHNESQEKKILSESSPEISTCESDISYSRLASTSFFLPINLKLKLRISWHSNGFLLVLKECVVDYLSVGILLRCLAGNFLGIFKENVAMKVITSTFLNMESCTTTRTFLTWTGCLLLRNPARKSHMRGSFLLRETILFLE